MTPCQIAPSPSNPTNFITATHRPLRHLRSRHRSLEQTQPVSLVPSPMKKYATHSNITNSSRSPNIGTFGLVALPMNSSGYSKVFCEHKGTDTCFFIKKLDVPMGRTFTYACIVCNYRPQKDEPHRIWLTMGGDCIDYPWDKSMQTAKITTAKLLFNSTISTPGASFYGIDLTNFYLNTLMECYKYMHLWLDILPPSSRNY
jgi:hypothetical protein